MTALFAILSVALIAVVIVQIGRVTELAAKIRGCVWSAYHYKNWMLGYGPHEAASIHGKSLDGLFDTTLVFTGIVFILTQIALFWFAYKYREQEGRKSLFLPHDNFGSAGFSSLE